MVDGLKEMVVVVASPAEEVGCGRRRRDSEGAVRRGGGEPGGLQGKRRGRAIGGVTPAGRGAVGREAGRSWVRIRA